MNKESKQHFFFSDILFSLSSEQTHVSQSGCSRLQSERHQCCDVQLVRTWWFSASPQAQMKKSIFHQVNQGANLSVTQRTQLAQQPAS